MIDRQTDNGPRVFLRVLIRPRPNSDPRKRTIAQTIALELVEYISQQYEDSIERPEDGGGQDDP